MHTPTMATVSEETRERISALLKEFPRKRRLPIFGESRADAEIRRAYDDDTFGDFLTAQLDDDGLGVDAPPELQRGVVDYLVHFLDCQEDLDGMSLADAERLTRECETTPYEAEELDWARAYFLAEAIARECPDLADDAFDRAGSVSPRFHNCPRKDGRGVPVPRISRGIPLPEVGGVYFLQTQAPLGPIKIGKAGNIRQRAKGLQTSHPWPLTLLAVIPGDGSSEPRWHERFAHLRLSGEWFRPGPDLLGAIDHILYDHRIGGRS